MTVGTHEQQFNRLIKEVDSLKERKLIEEEVFIQTGYSDYEPRFCEWAKFINYDAMDNYMRESRVVITHGGPASFLSVLQQRKSPIVVPRKAELNEHVNDHQLKFAKKIKGLGYSIHIVENIQDLSGVIKNIKVKDEVFLSNNYNFNQELNKIIRGLV